MWTFVRKKEGEQEGLAAIGVLWKLVFRRGELFLCGGVVREREGYLADTFLRSGAVKPANSGAAK